MIKYLLFTTLLSITTSALASNISGFSDIPKFEFREDNLVLVNGTNHLDANFDTAASMSRCSSELAKKKNVILNLGYTVVEENPCSAETSTSSFNQEKTIYVKGSFSFLK